MKFSSVIALATCLTAATATANSIGGNAGVDYCEGDGSNDLLTIKEINIEPNPPMPGKPIKVTATGHSNVEISENTEVELHFKKGIFKKTFTESVCEGAQKCPSKDLNMSFEKNVPHHAPKGKWEVTVKVKGENADYACLKGNVKIGK